MLLETHAHTSRHSSCSGLSPAELVRRCVAKKLQGVIIVEHRYLWTPSELADLARETGAPRGFVIIAGQEIQTAAGHIIVLGADKTISSPTEISSVKKRWPGAALILAHPFRGGKLPSDALLLDRRLDAIEIFNTNHTMKENCAALSAWHRLKFTATSGSDAHAPETAGVYPTLFDHPVTTAREAALEIKKGRVRPFHKEIPKTGGNVSVTEITIGTKGDDEARRRVILRSFSDDKEFLRARRAAELAEALRKNGFDKGPFRVPAIIEIQPRDRIIIEEGQRGKNLKEAAGNSSTETAKRYFELAAKWLARLHSRAPARLALETVGGTAKTLERENRRFRGYLNSFVSTKNPLTAEAEQLIDYVAEKSEKLLKSGQRRGIRAPTLCHGDYHPKNIIVGQDISHDAATGFISVIDFGSAITHHPAFDVGYFLAQFENQFFDEKTASRRKFSSDGFIDVYYNSLPSSARDKETRGTLAALAELFKIRANLSIAAFLIKVGKGESAEAAAAVEKSLSIMKRLRRGDGL